MSLIKQAIIRAARYPDSEEENKGLRLEHVLGLGTAGATMLPLLTNKPMMDTSKVQQMSAKKLFSASRPGDIILTHNKAPYSAWRAVAPAISGSPYYHAEVVGKGGYGRMAGSSEQLVDSLRQQQGGLLLRPKVPLTAQQKRRIMAHARALTKEDYSGTKAIATAAMRTVGLPVDSKLIPSCKGNVCSTGPADVYRKAGLNPGLKAPKGYELASDYLRSDKYKPVGVYGTRYNLPKWDKVYNPAIRTAMAAGLGGSVYQTVKDIREGESMAPLAALAGVGLGGLAGWKLEGAAGEADAVKHIRKNWVGGKILTDTGGRRKVLRKLMNNINNKASLTPAAGLAAVGGLGAYGLAKLLYARQRRRREEEANRLASRS